MAKSPEAVASFLKDVSDRLTPLYEQEMKVLLELKVWSNLSLWS
jgi:hypothetical protein